MVLAIENCRLPIPHLQQMLFSNFDLKLYPENIKTPNGNSYRQIAREALSAAMAFANSLAKGINRPGLIFEGAVGSGKTFLAAAIASELLAKGVDVEFIVVPEFLDQLLQQIHSNDDSETALINRINYDLANDLGNLLSRTTAMVQKYFGGSIPAQRQAEDLDQDLVAMATSLRGRYEESMDGFQFSNALAEVWKLIARSNKYIDETMPWALGKAPDKAPRLAAVLYNLCECLRIVSILITPFMPETAPKIQAQIGAGADVCNWDSADQWGLLPADAVVSKGETLFPRIDVAKEIAELDEILIQKPAEKKAEAPKREQPVEGVAMIGIDDFAKVELRVAEIVACEPVKRAKKLLKLTLNDGQGQRVVASGIAKYYTPDQLVGRHVVLVANLKPAVLCGVESCGMILAADCAGGDVKVIFVDEIPAGSKIR